MVVKTQTLKAGTRRFIDLTAVRTPSLSVTQSQDLRIFLTSASSDTNRTCHDWDVWVTGLNHVSHHYYPTLLASSMIKLILHKTLVSKRQRLPSVLPPSGLWHSSPDGVGSLHYISLHEPCVQQWPGSGLRQSVSRRLQAWLISAPANIKRAFNARY